MAKQPDSGSWLIIEELLERGDPAFLLELRACDDADRLGNFAAKWFADKSPTARRFLLKYVEMPLNAYHHEPLVKRLFKLAEAAGDDAVMARFLVTFDRSVRRVLQRRFHFEHQNVERRELAHALMRKWQEEGAENTYLNEWDGRFFVSARWPVERVRTPFGSTMPRGTEPRFRDFMTKLGLRGESSRSKKDLPLPIQKKLAGCQLFSVHTRHYLHRRAWRYFASSASFIPSGTCRRWSTRCSFIGMTTLRTAWPCSITGD